MFQIGKENVFERKYMGKFRNFASQFGEFVSYEHDRGARDIGLHLTKKLKSRNETLSSALCWFQMKGITAKKFSKEEFKKKSEIKIQLKVKHLRYWYIQPMPTYLILYIESADIFLILNIQKYICEMWGNDIFELKQKLATVSVKKSSVLDEQAFNLILSKCDIEAWKKVIQAEIKPIQVCRRDYNLIWHIGTAKQRKVEHKVTFKDWQSKMRGEIYFYEKNKKYDSEWVLIREHWEFGFGISKLEVSYPYLEFFDLQSDEAIKEYSYEEEYGYEEEHEMTDFKLLNGDIVKGLDCSSELFEYSMGVRINEIGKAMLEWVLILVKVGLVEINPEKTEVIDIAPWHNRQI